MSKMFDDVKKFHEKFGIIVKAKPGHLTKRKLIERIEFLQEELDEFIDACGIDPRTWELNDKPQDLAKQADALIDLVYVALGTAVMLGLVCWDKLWDDVQRANMAKVRGKTHRGHQVDVTKPEGWMPPTTDYILLQAGYVKNLDQHQEADDEPAPVS